VGTVRGCSHITAVVGVFLKGDNWRARAEGEVLSSEDLLGEGGGGNHERGYAAEFQLEDRAIEF